VRRGAYVRVLALKNYKIKKNERFIFVFHKKTVILYRISKRQKRFFLLTTNNKTQL